MAIWQALHSVSDNKVNTMNTAPNRLEFMVKFIRNIKRCSIITIFCKIPGFKFHYVPTLVLDTPVYYFI